MDKELPRITIVMTCFNALETIERAVRSAQAQTWPNLEILIQDDFSTDGTGMRVRYLISGDPRAKLTLATEERGNRGYAATLNELINRATGEFIAIFDDDDESAPDRLLKQWQRLTAYESKVGSQLVFCYSNRHIVKPGQQNPDHQAKAIGRVPPEPHGMMVADHLLWNPGTPGFTWGMFGSCTLMARRSTFFAVGSWDNSFRRCAEWDYAIRLAQLGGHFIAVDEPLVTQFKTPTQDKSRRRALWYATKLRFKYQGMLWKRLLFPSALFVGFARYAGAYGHTAFSKLYLLIACLLAPWAFSPHMSLKLRSNKKAS